jgi:2-dehydropantoate 2-reductase
MQTAKFRKRPARALIGITMHNANSNITVVGPGAVGGTLAAFLSQDSRFQVSIGARTAFERLVIETADGMIEAKPILFTDPAQAHVADWVLVATKAYDVVATRRWLANLVGPATMVAVLQNGVEHLARFADALPTERIVPVVVDVSAERLAPGHIRQRRSGTMVVPAGSAGEQFVALFARSPIHVFATDDFATVAWTKLASNCTGVVNALVRKPAGIAAGDDIADLIRMLVRECVLVGRAEGATLDDGLPDRVVENYRRGPPDTVNSLYADFAAGRPMELDARNGVIVRLGARHNIPTPINALMVTLLEAASSIAFPLSA